MTHARCPKCRSGNVIGYMGKWECMDCGHKFAVKAEQPFTFRQTIREEGPSKHKRTNISIFCTAMVIISLLTGLMFGYLISQTMIQTQTIKNTITIFQSTTMLIEITQTTTQNITRTMTPSEQLTTTLISTLRETITATITVTVTPTIRTEELVIKIGEPINLDAWEIQINSVEEVAYIRCDDRYYAPREGMKLLIVNIIIANNGEEELNTGEIWQVMLLTDSGRSHRDISIESLYYIPLPEVTPEIEEQAMEFKPRGIGHYVMPGTHVEEQLLFQIPELENPIAMYIRISTHPTKVIIVSFE